MEKPLFSEEFDESQMNMGCEDTAYNLLEDIRCLQEDKRDLEKKLKKANEIIVELATRRTNERI